MWEAAADTDVKAACPEYLEYATIEACPNSYLQVSESQVLLVLAKFCLGEEKVGLCLSQA